VREADLMGLLTGSDGNRSLVNIAIIMTVLALPRDSPADDFLYQGGHRTLLSAPGHRDTTTSPNQVIVGLSLFLTFFIMAQPSSASIHKHSPLYGKADSFEEFTGKASKEMGTFMLRFAGRRI